MERMLQSRRINLKELADSKWFSNPADSTFLISIYSVLGVPIKYITKVWPQQNMFSITDKMIIHVGTMRGLKIPEIMVKLISDDMGDAILDVFSADYELKESPHVMFIQPSRVDGFEIPDAQIFALRDEAITVIRAHCGFNFIREKIAEFFVHAGTGGFLTKAKPTRLPRREEGPYCAPINWVQMQEIADKIKYIE